MAEVNLTQAEADALLALGKCKIDDRMWGFPYFGGKIIIPLESRDGREQFLLDLHRGKIDLAKTSYQNRARRVAVLARLDIGGPPHRNPDGEEIPCPHLHRYVEGYADKWAWPAPLDTFANPRDSWQALQDFMQFCNIVEPPHFIRKLLP